MNELNEKAMFVQVAEAAPEAAPGPMNQAGLLVEQLALAHQQLQHLQEMQQHTAALLSYELRTQFTTILGSAELLNTQLPGALNEKQGRLLAEINAAGRRLFHRINVVLEYQLLQAGVTVLDLRDVDAPAVCRTVLEGLADEAAARQQRLRLSCPPDAVAVRADEARLQLMLDQLLRHALHCAPVGGCADIAVKVQREGDVEFRIGNNGAGLCADELALLFLPFTTAAYNLPHDREPAAVQPSTAIDCVHGARRLGIVLTRALAEAHGGALTVENRTGAGAAQAGCFRLVLPAAAAQQRARGSQDNGG